MSSKPQTLQGYVGKMEKKMLQAFLPSKSTTLAESSKPSTPRRSNTQRPPKTPQVSEERPAGRLLLFVSSESEVVVDVWKDELGKRRGRGLSNRKQRRL